MAIYELDGQAPELPADGRYWVAETAVVIGRVRLKQDASMWWGSVLRGDNEWIEVGERTNIQESCTLHTDMGFPMAIGADCTIGHNVVLHGCTIAAGSLIGMGAVVLNGAKIGPRSLVGAGALVTEGKEFPAELADRRRAGARDPHARREGREIGVVRGRMVCEALEPVRKGTAADRLTPQSRRLRVASHRTGRLLAEPAIENAAERAADERREPEQPELRHAPIRRRTAPGRCCGPD